MRIWTKLSRLMNELSENEENLINVQMKQLSNILANSSLSGKREAGLLPTQTIQDYKDEDSSVHHNISSDLSFVSDNNRQLQDQIKNNEQRLLKVRFQELSLEGSR